MAEEVSAQYPPPRLGTELVLLEVDPHRTHAYWNVDTPDFEAAAKLAGGGATPMVLRFFEVSADPAAEPGRPFDVEVQGLQNHWYVDLWNPGRSYVAELGLRRPDGHLVVLARSNRVDNPPAGESSIPCAPAPESCDQDVGAVAQELAGAARARAANTEPGLPDVAPPPAELLINRYPESASPPPATPLPPAAPAAVGPWPTAEELVQHLPDPKPLFDAVVAQAEAAVAPAPSGAGEAAAPAAPGAGVAPAPAPVPPSALPLDQYVNLSSFVNGRSDVALEVNVELHVYGRARPGSRLSFYGQDVALRPDGTFSIRKPLPQGALVLPLVLHDEPGKDA